MIFSLQLSFFLFSYLGQIKTSQARWCKVVRQEKLSTFFVTWLLLTEKRFLSPTPPSFFRTKRNIFSLTKLTWWFGFRLQPILTDDPVSPNNLTHFKSGQKRQNSFITFLLLQRFSIFLWNARFVCFEERILFICFFYLFLLGAHGKQTKQSFKARNFLKNGNFVKKVFLFYNI